MSFPIRAPKSPEAKRAAELYERAQAAPKNVATVQAARVAAHEEVRRLTDALAAELFDVYRSGSATSKKASDLTAKLAAAEQTAAEPWAVRVHAAESAAQSLLSEYRAYVDAEFEALHEELRPEGEAARERLLSAIAGPSLDELHAAFAVYRDVAGRVHALARYATHLDANNDVCVVLPYVRRGDRLKFPNGTPRRIDSPDDAVAIVRTCEELNGDLDAALPLPLVTDSQLQWRRDRLAGVTVKPGRGLGI